MSSWSFLEENLIRNGVVIGKFDGGIAEILEHKDGVVIRTRTEEGEGVFYVNPDGSIKWRIDGSKYQFQEPIYYVSIFFLKDQLIASEFTSYDCYVDIETGKVTKIDFTK